MGNDAVAQITIADRYLCFDENQYTKCEFCSAKSFCVDLERVCARSVKVCSYFCTNQASKNRNSNVNGAPNQIGCSYWARDCFPLIARIHGRPNRNKIGTEENLGVLSFLCHPVLFAVCPENFGKIVLFNGVSGNCLLGYANESVEFLNALNCQGLPSKVSARGIPFFQGVVYPFQRHWGIVVKTHVLRDVVLNNRRSVTVEL